MIDREGATAPPRKKRARKSLLENFCLCLETIFNERERERERGRERDSVCVRDMRKRGRKRFNNGKGKKR